MVVMLTGLASAMFMMSLAHNREVSNAGERMRAFYQAEAGVTETLSQVAAASGSAADVPLTVGTRNDPVRTARGRFWCDVNDNGDNTFTVTSTGAAGFGRRRVQAVLSPVGGGIFDHAIFAGNDSGDPNYELTLGGNGGQADDVTGNIYSGGDVTVTGDATVTGDLASGGVITGETGEEGVHRPLPDIAGMNYATNHDYDVAAMFAADETWVTGSDRGGDAYELPESNPAHIFRKNPDDRPDEVNGTTKDDYFLEDPYGPLKDFTPSYTSNQGHTVTLSGVDGAPGPNANDKVYFIDGNLWVHNRPYGRMRFINEGPDGVKLTFVVKGNVYFSDDVLVENTADDGVAFIAIEDPGEADSGNIYLGDPRYGTVERIEAYLYAENNFYDINLSASGSKDVTLIGNMTAGNHVAIDRDHIDGNGDVTHSKLTVEFDPRLAAGDINLPGLPRMTGSGTGGFEVVFWREIALE
jgi:hypothetical protein